MNNRQKMEERLRVIKNNPRISVDNLRSMHLISERYDFRNLAVDRWYILPRSGRATGLPIERCDTTDYLRTVWFRTILLALADASTGRPCDLNAWREDMAPYSIDVCTEDVHICAPSALAFLINMREEQEMFARLSPGTTIWYARRIQNYLNPEI